ncbi:putative zinc finger ccch domain-containing protein 3 protein [Botrytis fragariae]|uniref:Putative zinc finger ccch domain-containing protein 3 protein n=1 Tax=Botrytis fragariae TaxID=1964551 RepID=A0A8H6AK90_9HELO|nr:putative zinc finger ccch domain-containing protein 3 protein [Botrytis fragariae]KAF5869171.1 putative zinc finger ccch domain-containing protein 3 protein [Botrytis fragariae]
MGICVYYPIGRCVAGDQCHNKHTGPYQPFPCKNYIFHGTCKWGLECRFGHPASIPAENPEPSRPVCKNFLSRRGCKYGSKCLSHHPVPTEKVASSATSALKQSQSTTATPAALKTAKSTNIKLSKAKPTNTKVAPLMNFRSARVLPKKPQVAPTTTNVPKDEGSTNTQLSKEKSASTSATPSKESSSTPALLQAQVTMDTQAISSTADAVDKDPSYKDPTHKIPAPSIDSGPYEIALSPIKLTSVSNSTSDTGATNTGSSNDQPDGTITTPSMSSDSTPGTPSFQVLTPASTSIGNADDIGYVSSSDIMLMSDSSELVRSATRSPSPTDDSHDTSMSTVPDDPSTPVKPVPVDSKPSPADSTDATKPSDVLVCGSITPLFTAPDFINARQVSAVKPPGLVIPNHLFDQSVDEAPINGIDNTMPPNIPVEASNASSYTVPTESSVDSEQAFVVQSTDLVLSPNELSNQTTTTAPVEETQISVMEHVSTDYRSAMNKLSRVVVDWSATLEPSNLELSGPGIYERHISHTEVLVTWPQEWNVPAIDMINTLIHLASTWGELSTYQPIHRNMGSWHSLQIRFRHRHEAAAAATAINGHLITAVGACMSIPVTVSHQIAVQYMIPRYIIDSLGRQNQGNLHQIFGQNSCQLHWGESYRADYSGEKLMEVTIMGICEEQVAQCKAVLEDLLRGRVLTHEEGDNRPLWHKFFKTEEGTKWIAETTTNIFDMKVRAAKLANLDILMVYGSSEWSRARFGALVKKKIVELEKTAAVTAVVVEELRLMRLRVKG